MIFKHHRTFEYISHRVVMTLFALFAICNVTVSAADEKANSTGGKGVALFWTKSIHVNKSFTVAEDGFLTGFKIKGSVRGNAPTPVFIRIRDMNEDSILETDAFPPEKTFGANARWGEVRLAAPLPVTAGLQLEVSLWQGAGDKLRHAVVFMKGGGDDSWMFEESPDDSNAAVRKSLSSLLIEPLLVKDVAFTSQASTGPFLSVGRNGRPASQTTIATLRRTDKSLQVKFDCDDAEIISAGTGRDDGGIFTGDSVEFFVAVKDPNQYFRFASSSDGAQLDSLGADKSWNGEWTLEKTRTLRGWSVKFDIPFSTITSEPTTSGTIWHMNFCRTDMPAKEASSWGYAESGSGSAFHNPKAFGVLRFHDNMGIQLQRVASPGMKALDPSAPLGKPAESQFEQTPWRNTLQTPVRVVFLTAFDTQREVVELARHLNMDYEVVEFSKPKYSPPSFFSPGNVDRNLNKALRTKNPDVLVNCGYPLDCLPGKTQDEILARINAGMGLFTTSRNGSSKLSETLPFSEQLKPAVTSGKLSVATDHYITRGIPFETLPESACFAFQKRATAGILLTCGDAPVLGIMESGAGRIASLTLWSDPCRDVDFTPRGIDHKAFSFQYFEYFLRLAARSVIWCAHKESATALRNVRYLPDGNVMSASVDYDKSAAPDGLSVECVQRDRYSGVYARSSIPLKPDVDTFSAPLPVNPAYGLNFVDLILRAKDGRAMDFATVAFDNENVAHFASLTPALEKFAIGDDVKLTAGVIPGDPCSPAPKIISIRINDGDDRLLLDRKTSLNTVDFPCDVSLSAKIAIPATSVAQGELRLLDANGGLLDRSFLKIAFQTPARKDYLLGLSGASSQLPYLEPLFYKELKKHGVNAFLFIPAGMSGENQAFADLGEIAACGLTPGIDNLAGVVGYFGAGPIRQPCINDPSYIAYYRRTARDFTICNRRFSPAFYGIGDEAVLAAGNTGVGANFRSVKTEVCKCDYCKNAFKEFLKMRYRDLEKLNRQWDSKLQSWNDVRICFFNELKTDNLSQWIDSRVFMDEGFSQLMETVSSDISQLDPGACVGFSGTHERTPFTGVDPERMMRRLNVFGYSKDLEYLESFRPHGTFPICTGYSVPPYPHPWDIALHGGGGASFFGLDRYDVEDCRAHLHPSCAPNTKTKLMEESTAVLRAGVGLLLADFPRADQKVGIIYSQESLYAAYAKSQKDFDGYVALQRRVWKLVEALQRQPRFISEKELAQETIGNLKLLIAADASCMSDAAMDSVCRFVKNGGTLLTVGDFNLRDSHGKRRESENTAYGKLLEDGKAIATTREKLDRGFLAGLLSQIGLPPLLSINERNGDPSDAECFMYFKDNVGKTVYFGVEGLKKGSQIRFPRKGHLYDVVKRTYLGFTDAITYNDAIGLFALCDFKITGVNVERRNFADFLSLDISVEAQGGNIKDDRVARVLVRRPDNSIDGGLSSNVILKNGSGNVRIPFSLSQPDGVWRMEVYDVASDQCKTIDVAFGRPETSLNCATSSFTHTMVGNVSARPLKKLPVIETLTSDRTFNPSTSASYKPEENLFHVQMGGASMWGSRWCGVKTEGIKKLTLEFRATGSSYMMPIHSTSQAAMIFDYGSGNGFKRRICFGLGLLSRAGSSPTWGKGSPPDEYIDMAGADFHREWSRRTVDLRDFAPIDWNGELWISCGIENCPFGEYELRIVNFE